MYKLNFKSQVKTLSVSLFSLVIVIIILLINHYFFDEKVDLNILILCFTGLYGLAVYLYIEYVLFSMYVKVYIDSNNKLIQFHDKRGFREYPLNEIKEIIMVCSYPKGEYRNPWMPTDSFFFYVVVFKDNYKIVLTSLMVESFSIYGFRIKLKKVLSRQSYTGNYLNNLYIISM